jgi:DNA-binding GntR family transcriptional regulator
LGEHAYRVIRERIITVELGPGSAFSEAGIASQLGLSKTPVREALTALQRDGLVTAVPRSGYRVSAVTLAETRDLLAVRSVLETEAAGLAATRSGDAEELVALNDLCRIGFEPADKGSIRRFLRANTDFHWTVARMGGNHRLASMLRDVLDELERVFHVGLAVAADPMSMVHEHQDLVRAILSGDAAEARRVAEAQSRASQLMVLSGLLSSPSLLSASITADPAAALR